MIPAFPPIGSGIAALLIFTLSAATPVSSNAGEIAKKITGEVKIQSRTDESRHPSSPPSVIYVRDFDLGYSDSQEDSGGRGRIIGRVLPRLSQRNDPEQKAKKLVSTMTETLINGFTKNGIVTRQAIPGTPLPPEGWLISGVFTEVDQGKRLIRATIGFGAGSTEMEVYVTVGNLADTPWDPFIIFGTEKEPNRIPGAVVTKNPYVAAAKFVMGKNASDRDAKKTAGEIVETVMKYIKSLDNKGKPDQASPDR
jgi:hypothetical protein